MRDADAPEFDVIIVGGGPAGLSAALVLGRCRRDVLVIDAGKPRNAVARAMHGFLSRDGENPHEMLRIAREQLGAYPGVRLQRGCVCGAERGQERFVIRTDDGTQHSCRILLLATGIADELPALENIHQFWGSTVHLCPYCDGWEHRDQKLVIYGHGMDGGELALELFAWSRDLVFCTDGPADLAPEMTEKLKRLGIPIDEEPIEKLEGEGDQLKGVRFASGRFLECSGLFFSSGQRQCCDLARQLDCELDDEGTLIEHSDTCSGVPGLYVAGNTCTGLQLVIIAAAEGTEAAFKINQALVEKDREKAYAACEQSRPIPQPNTAVAR